MKKTSFSLIYGQWVFEKFRMAMLGGVIYIEKGRDKKILP